MIRFLKELWLYLKLVWSSRFKYMMLLFVLWLYRIDFMPDTGGGLAKGIQIVSILGLLYYISKYSRNIVGYSYSHTNLAIKSCLVLYTYALISTAWAYMPSLALFMSFQNLVMVMLLVWFFNLFRDFRSMEKGFLGFALSSVLFECIVYRILHPSVMIHFLGGGSSAALIFAYCVAEWMKANDKKRKRFLKYSMIVSFILMATCTSMGANAAALFGFGLACLFAGKVLWAAFILICSMFLYANSDLIDDIILALNPGKTKEMIETGNGREEIWEALLDKARQKPLFGWGYACIERTTPDVLGGQILSDAHNNYIGMYGSLGVVGLVLFVFHQVVSALSAFGHRMKAGYLGLFVAMATAAVNSYSYGFLSGKGCSITVVYFALVVLTFYYGKVSYQR